MIVIGYHGTTLSRWAAIEREGVLWGVRPAVNGNSGPQPSRCTYLASDRDEAACYGDVVLTVEIDASKVTSNYVEGCWQWRVYDPIPLDCIKDITLGKGLLGEKNANLIGLIMIGKLQMAAMSRAESPDLSQFPPFYVYLDEFQNVVTDSIAAILSEARKYKLSLNMTHQYLGQLSESIKGAVFGNVGSMAFFRINDEDAKFVEPRVAPQFSKDDIIKQDNFNCITSLLVNGRPSTSFNMMTVHDGYAPKGNPDQIAAVKQLSYLKYGRDRQEVEQEILSKFNISR
jgi:hypothetical protein